MLPLATTSASLALLTQLTKWGQQRLLDGTVTIKGGRGELLLEVPVELIHYRRGASQRNAGDKTECQSIGNWGSLRMSFSWGPPIQECLVVTKIKDPFLSFVSINNFFY